MTLKEKTEQVYKYAVLATKGESSCYGCKTGYCCTKQRIIEISSVEWIERQSLIAPKHLKRAKQEVDTFDRVGYFTCPFLDPVTKLCDIYNERFFVCATYHVVNPVEHCNSETMNDLQVINPMEVMKVIQQDNASGPLVNELAKLAYGEPLNLIEAFRQRLKE